MFNKHKNQDFRFKIQDKKGYTLLEVLISIAIFSGLLILSLGAVATSSGSSSKVGSLREKSQATRSLIDRMTDDFRFINTTKTFKVNGFGPPPGGNCNKNGPTPCTVVGFSIGGTQTPLEEAIFMLHYPSDPDNIWSIKYYEIAKRGNEQHIRSLFLSEVRDCTLLDNPSDPNYPAISLNLNNLNFGLGSNACRGGTQAKVDLLNLNYILNDLGNPSDRSGYYGLPVNQAITESAYMKINFNLKHIDYFDKSCTAIDTPVGACYKLETTLTSGKK